MSDQYSDQQLIASWRNWHHLITFPSGARTPGRYDPRGLFNKLRLPDDMTSMRVLDVGARDGFFSFECERRGADVVAIDHCPAEKTGFPVARTILGSKVPFVECNIYDIANAGLGYFDIVLFLGIYYHLRHPLLALDAARSVCEGSIYIESLVLDKSLFRDFMQPSDLDEYDANLSTVPIAQFLPRDQLHADWTNRWVPNVECLKATVEDSLFDVVHCDTCVSFPVKRTVHK